MTASTLSGKRIVQETADVTTLLPVVDRLGSRFHIGRVCVVADRGMISADTIAGLEERKLEYILGARERTDAVARRIALANDEPFVPLLVERKAGETQGCLVVITHPLAIGVNV
jgi:transposase